MAVANDIGTISGDFKEVYGDEVISLIPKQYSLQKKIRFEKGEKDPGNYYNESITLADEAGVTHGVAEDGAFTLDPPVPMINRQARVRDSSIVLRAAIANDIIQRSRGGKQAFKKATELVVQSMLNAIAKRVEVTLIYGSSVNGLARVTKSATPPVIDDTVPAASTGTFPIAAGHWAPGIWAGAKGVKLDAYKYNATLSSQAFIGTCSVLLADYDNKTLKLVGAKAAMDAIALALETDMGGGDVDVVFCYKGSRGKEMVGLDRVCTNTGSLFNIDAAEFDLWKSNEYTSTGELSETKINSAIMKLVSRGGENEVGLIVPVRAWNVLMSAAATGPTARVVENYNPKEVSFGHENVVMRHALGKMEVIASLYLKEGDIFILDFKTLKRVGNQEVTFKSPLDEKQFVLPLADADGVEFRCRTQQALFCNALLRNGKMSGITYASGF